MEIKLEGNEKIVLDAKDKTKVKRVENITFTDSNGNTLHGDMVFVNAHIREDGTVVCDYDRHFNSEKVLFQLEVKDNVVVDGDSNE